MLQSTTVVRNVPQQNLMNELRFFLKGATPSKKEKSNPLDVTKSALVLLKGLPACRVGIFDYFRYIFDNAASHYIEGIEVKDMNHSFYFVTHMYLTI